MSVKVLIFLEICCQRPAYGDENFVLDPQDPHFGKIDFESYLSEPFPAAGNVGLQANRFLSYPKVY